MSLDPTLRHFLYKTSSNALMRHYFVNRFARIHSILNGQTRRPTASGSAILAAKSFLFGTLLGRYGASPAS